MRVAGNAIWFVFGGALSALIWLLGAAIFAISIVGLPLSRSAFEIAKMSAFPFGKDVVHIRELDNKGVTARTAVTGTIGFVFNVLWALTFGIVLFVTHIVVGIICCLTVIGIPFGIQSFKLAGIALWPVGRRVVPVELAKVARETNAASRLAAYRQRT
jgi:uncharacterized membrane protein YccF (DUF307 family)